MDSSTSNKDEYKGGDKYRSHIYGDEEKNTLWKFGAPPNYDVANKLFEEGRTQVWEKGSLEEWVQHMVKTWEMEMFHKIRPQDYKTLNPDIYTFNELFQNNVDDEKKIEKVEFFYDRGELLGQLVEGELVENSEKTSSPSTCPFMINKSM